MLRLLVIFLYYGLLELHLCNGAEMTIQPDVIVLGGGKTPEVTMTCSLSASELTSSDIDVFTYIRINRNRTIDHHDYFSPIAMIIGSLNPTLTSPDPDVSIKNPTLSGTLATGSSTTPNKAELKVTWGYGTLGCEDDGQYECEISYLDKNHNNQIHKSAATLQVQSIASNLTIGGTVNGHSIADNEGTKINKVNATVGDTVELNCSGYIGTDPSTAIDWYYTLPTDSVDKVQMFYPGTNDTITSQPANYSDTKCSFFKSSTLKYQIREADANRQNNLELSCAVIVTVSGQQIIVFSQRPIYVHVSPKPTQAPSTSTQANTTPVISTHSETTSHLVPTHEDTTLHTVPTHADTTVHMVPTHAETTTRTAPTILVSTNATSSPAPAISATPSTTLASTAFTASSTADLHHNTPDGGGLVCLSCQSVVQPRHCHTVQRCLPDQACGVETVMDQFGDVYYNVGCMNKDMCAASRVGRSFACRECCQADLCNAKGCGQPGYPDNTGPVCYSCSMLPPGRTCHSVNICQRHQACFIDQFEEFGDILVTRGCRSELMCQELAAAAGTGSSGESGVSLVGRRSLFTESKSEKECLQCCTGSLCNGECPTIPCTDAVDSCPYLVKTLNLCGNVTMAQQCRLSCGLCQGPVSTLPPTSPTTITTTTTTPIPTTTTTTPKPTTTPCRDFLDSSACQYLQEHLGVCKNVSLATSGRCKATCGFCEATTPAVKYRDCMDIKTRNPGALSGVYHVVAGFGTDRQRELEVYCDMVTDGGGWTVFQRRFNGSVDFYRGISDYEHGFGSTAGEFWLGLQGLYDLTAGGQHTLRVDVVDSSSRRTFEEYAGFHLGPPPTFTFHLSGRTHGNADGKLMFYDGSPFSAKDMDRDVFTSDSCAVRYHGAFWYAGCLRDSNPNGLYKPGPDPECDFYAMSYSNCDGNIAIEMKFK